MAALSRLAAASAAGLALRGRLSGDLGVVELAAEAVGGEQVEIAEAGRRGRRSRARPWVASRWRG